MIVGLPALLLLAQAASAASYGPPDPPAPKPPTVPVPASTTEPPRTCPLPDTQATNIVVCALKPDGYRLNPDVMAARKLKKQGDPGRPRNPHETYADHSCATVGPIGCRGGPGFNVIGAATTLVAAANRLAKGQEVGSLLETDPTHSEYQLYAEAKKERERREAEKAAKAVRDAGQAKAAATASATAQQSATPALSH